MMHEVIDSPAAESCVGIEVESGFPPLLDDLASRAIGARAFLRSAWYAGDGAEGTTLVARRIDGGVIAAIPTIPIGPAMLGARTVPGSYWPFRSILIDESATQGELTEAFKHSLTRSLLTPMWRVGPIYKDDPATVMLKRAAARAGWTVLTRHISRTFVFDLAASEAEGGWPRKSTRRRLAGYEKQLGAMGEVSYRHVTGADWDEAAFAALAAIEANSWVGKSTDGSGAKFLSQAQRKRWRTAVADPVLAEALSAAILFVGDVPAAFSFDLQDGATQYSIASSYDDRFAAGRPGRIVTWRQLEWARGRGVTMVDLGAGDSGYKQDMGAVAGSEILDLLIVRSRSAAKVLKLKWGEESAIGRDAFLPAADIGHAAMLTRIEPWLAAGAIAAAALALSE
ncbi:GNAT family N-acetyltransferase [Sphingomonas sp. G-3-2-10]|uniref:GNAT family N-acetyltransferase n=1 Tax=Sphingomonas sp. G-3-2-10 TaxID=2728838 RepID=UPI00146CC757|nr:GNAT family N-acetyltransferase [Sphingomonas sp. G-3-2-10]NML05233.1 GNAT family N-acetyltransferase [Sphingomonas sp. G-3-2-10]